MNAMTQSVFVSGKHRAVVVPATAQLRGLFPQAPVLPTPQPMLVLPHVADTTRLLRNMGFDAPAPVLSQYDWCGGNPFEVQKKTAAMLTTNPRAYVLNGLGCVDADTEYLSPTGWVRIADYPGGKVAQYQPTDGSIEFVEPSRYVKLPCPEMIRIKTTYGVDQLLSPEHRVLLHAADNPDKREVLHAADLLARHDRYLAGKSAVKSQSRIGFSQAAIPVTFRFAGAAGVDLADAELRLQVAVVADGHFPSGCSTNRCTVRVKKPRKIDRMRALLSAAGRSAYERPGADGFVLFTFDAPIKVKEFDARFWHATQAQRSVIADEVLRWDGCTTRGARFSTTSKATADFVQFVFASLGRTARVLVDRRVYACGGPAYTVQVRGRGEPLRLKSTGKSGRNRVMWREASSDGFKYCFMVPSTFLLFRRNGCVFASGNTGKTKTALWSFDYLRGIGQAKRALVVAPLSTLNFVWGREAFATTPHLSTAVLHGSRQKRLDRLAEPHDIYIINPDGIGTVKEALLARPDIDTLIIDELAVFRSGNAVRSKNVKQLADRMRNVWGMTGSPTPNAPTDAWGQARIVTPHTVPKFFGQFRDLTMVKLSQFREAPKREAADVVAAAMSPAVRYTLDDVVELPDLVERAVDVELGKDQKRIYEELRRAAYAMIQSHEISAVNAGAVLNKLMQVSLGYVYAKPDAKGVRQVIGLDNDKRIDALVDIVEGCEAKVIVFVPFTHALNGVSAALAKAGFDVAPIIDGNTPQGKRAETFNLFQQTNKFKVLPAHPGTMAHGITLTAADTIVWFGPTTSYETFEQANARIRRIGQRRKQQILMLQATPAEKKAYAMLRQKRRVQDNILELFAEASQ